MDSFYISYRDPLFGIIVFFLLIFIVSFVNYWWSVYKNRDEEENIKKFIKKFQIDNSDDEEYKIIFEDKNLTLDTIILLAKSYEKIGQYKKSIGIYLYALSIYKKRAQKQNILFLLGKVYLRVGFLERAREIFIKSLSISPRHEESLKYLTVTYELLKEYKKAKEVLESLEELGIDIDMQKAYIEALLIKNDDMEIEKKRKLLYKLSTFKVTQRIYVEFMLQNYKEIDFKEIENFDFKNLLDIFWRFKKEQFDIETAKKSKTLRDILNAKSYIDINEECKIFEFEVIKNLKKAGYQKGDLSFEYFCDNCKNSYPFYFYRCPNCHDIDSMRIIPLLVRREYEKNISLL